MAFVKKGDSVVVLSGKDKGKQGKVLRVFPSEQKVIVEKVNFAKRHTRPNQQQPQGGILERELPLFISKVRIVCSKCNKSTGVGHRFLEDGQKVRICKKCGEILDKV